MVQPTKESVPTVREKNMTFIADLFLAVVYESIPKINTEKGNQMTKVSFSESSSNSPQCSVLVKLTREKVPLSQESSVLFGLCSQDRSHYHKLKLHSVFLSARLGDLITSVSQAC